MSALSVIREVAERAARSAGTVAMENYGHPLFVDARLASDLKLEVDRRCEKAVVDTIREHFPDHAILSEEMGSMKGEECVWYVDPLDGTVNYFHGMPYFCTTLACYRQTVDTTGKPDALGEPLVGVTYAPFTDEMCIAVAGQGVTLNGKPVAVREETSLEDCFFITSIGNDPDVIAFTRDYGLKISAHVRKTRNFGARAYDIANVAAGRASGFFEYRVQPWDVAAGKIQVEEAGGRFGVRQLPGGVWLGYAAGVNVYEQLVDLLADAVD